MTVPIGDGTHSLGTYTNTQLHSVLVIVCHQASGTLAPSPSDGKTSPTAAQATAAGTTEAALCALANAHGLTGQPHGNKELTVNVTH